WFFCLSFFLKVECGYGITQNQRRSVYWSYFGYLEMNIELIYLNMDYNYNKKEMYLISYEATDFYLFFYKARR
ncbi:MAG: hypothetical protein ACJASP_002333, partial [Roseivirga sp.]